MALVECPECKKSIGETASICPKCGFTLTPEIVAKEKQRRETNRLTFNLAVTGMVIFMLGGCVLIAGSLSSSRMSTGAAIEAEPTLAQKLAAIETQSWHGAHDSVLSSSMGRRLRRLSGKFPETEKQIADMTVKSQQLLEKKGISKRLTQIMDDIDYMVPSGELGVTYAELAAMYVTLQSQ